MNEIINMKREGAVFRIEIDVPLEEGKAGAIATLVEDDAGNATVSVSEKRRLRQITAKGVVSPNTVREIIRILAT